MSLFAGIQGDFAFVFAYSNCACFGTFTRNRGPFEDHCQSQAHP